MSTSLQHQQHPLAQASNQLRLLSRADGGGAFARRLKGEGIAPLRATRIEVLQVNVGKLCNQTCAHCHVDAGPDRRESMSAEIAELCLQAFESTAIPTLDITGGAPEMNPNFRRLVVRARQLDRHVIDRSNLTILSAKGFEDLPELLAEQQVEVVASLPCYLEENCDRQRGAGVFQRSIDGLRRLNALGYGRPGSRLVLTLVYNPLGPRLPPAQADLEAAYRTELHQRYGIEFNRLHTIVNMPISRFLDELVRTDQYESYMETLVRAFNPATTEGLMCRTTLSVDWQGFLYDCDFNQMLELPVHSRQHLRDFDLSRLEERTIATGPHCFGCTAGAGSSCQGALTR